MLTEQTLMTRRWEPASRAQIVHSLILVVGMASTFILGFGVIGPALGLKMDEVFSGSLPAMLTTALMGLYSVGGVVGLGLLLLGRVRPGDLGWRVDQLGRDVVAGLIGVVGLVACMLVVMLGFGLDLDGLFVSITSFTGPQRAQMLLIGVIAALGEESVFRGYLQPALTSRMGPATGIFLGAAIFAIYHVPVTPHAIGITAKFGFGLVLGLLRYRTGSLVPAAVAHWGFWQIMGFA
ncbi:MAG: CPBP family intramembrane metalloprotease [Myxococcales bacterium]|nr:CPBP family intramembrane metalloprotease [Myxococcales bacterium]